MSAVVARAEARDVEETVVVVASLAAKDAVTFISELDAKVVEILFEEGDLVKEGDPLFRLDETRTRARLDEAEASHKLAELTYRRNEQLLKNETISQQEFDRSEADYYNRRAAIALARDEQTKTEIAAPFGGIIGERDVSVGQYVSQGRELARLTRMDPLEVVFDVPERHLARLNDTLDIAFETDAYPGEGFTGQVTYVSPSVSERTRTVRVKAEIPNTNARLKPGMFGRLALILERRANALVIPEACIQFDGEATMVVAVDEAGKSVFKPVRVGRRFESLAEILEGLSAGDLVVVEGFQKMGPGMTIMAAPESQAYGVTPGPLGAATATDDSQAQAGDEVSHATH
jgi:membrane fusion protein (multidrug efflux system)